VPFRSVLVACLVLLLAPAGCSGPADTAGPSAFDAIVGKADKRAGLLTLYVDNKDGKVWLEVPASGELGRFLYVEGLVTGLGSNPVGLDRGQLGQTRLVDLRVQGGRLLVEQVNLGYRALSTAPAEVGATRESFATSVLWAGPVEARHDDGRALVDLTPFAVRDAHGVRATLDRSGQGAYKLDGDRSVLDTGAVLAFPDNVELESLLTFAADKPGSEVAAAAPSGSEFSVALHQSFVRLPDDGYRPRPFHSRSGSFNVSFANYAAPLDQSIATRYLVRHRLARGDSIVYYVDPGIPEPVRSAVVEGASWWAEAFAAAGFENAFRVEILPDDVHPLDVRYNVIQWVHRATRGWSYGFGVVDPRTGEMIKGHVNLGSLRVRQDRTIFEGLLGTADTGTGKPTDPVQLSLARIRQLAAHEVGHTLGFAHNFAASAFGRASVMDYPAPLVRLQPDGTFDVSAAYDTGIGDWDKLAARYAYGEFDDEAAGLQAVLDEARDRGLPFITDADSRMPGAAHPLGNLWDNGADPIAALDEVMAVRRLAIDRFGPDNLAADATLSELEEAFVPIYLFHRYQVEAAAKSVGGLQYQYWDNGDAGARAEPVAANDQRRALDALVRALAPGQLDIPEPLVRSLVPRAYGVSRSREQFDSKSRPAFDSLAAARAAADLVIAELTQRDRAARLLDQHRRDPALPDLAEAFDALVAAAFRAPAAGKRQGALAREVQVALTDRLVALAADSQARHGVRAQAEAALRTIATASRGAGAFETHQRSRIERFLRRSSDDGFIAAQVPAVPPGSPIGCSVHSGR